MATPMTSYPHSLGGATYDPQQPSRGRNIVAAALYVALFFAALAMLYATITSISVVTNEMMGLFEGMERMRGPAFP